MIRTRPHDAELWCAGKPDLPTSRRCPGQPLRVNSSAWWATPRHEDVPSFRLDDRVALLTDAASFCTSVDLVVDGGFTCW
ncbi:hypothetical protein ABNF97_24490 [Plantactinospora sp. B6F1]|uniref:hypothetical protein n=1 Tax=Plantactinospora sp. B6F1 TaxID=3158971 RepID=UPI0032D8BEFB